MTMRTDATPGGPPLAFLAALAAFQPSNGASPPRVGLSFATALSTHQRTTLCVHPKYKRREKSCGNLSCHAPPTLCYSKKRTSLRSENDGNHGEKQGRDASPPRRRRKGSITNLEFVRRTIDDGNAAAQALESSIRFLGQPVPIPFFGDLTLPLIYPLSTLLGVAILPPATGGLLVFFFGAYLSLGNSSLVGQGSDNFDSVRNDNQNGYDNDSEGEEEGVLLPLAAFTGALASAALLSPQGLVVSGSESFSLVCPLALSAVGLGGMTMLMGIKETGEEEERREEGEWREGVVREERSRMDRWDEDLEELFAEDEKD